MITPSFIYNPGGGNVTFTPTYPPTGKMPLGALSAIRHDSITSDGSTIQSVLERIDTLNTLDFKTIPESDLASWSAFLSYALSGASFNYVPDSTQPGTFTAYTLTDQNWIPKWVSFKTYAFTLQMRKV